jgi:hypothetical protein
MLLELLLDDALLHLRLFRRCVASDVGTLFCELVLQRNLRRLPLSRGLWFCLLVRWVAWNWSDICGLRLSQLCLHLSHLCTLECSRRCLFFLLVHQQLHLVDLLELLALCNLFHQSRTHIRLSSLLCSALSTSLCDVTQRETWNRTTRRNDSRSRRWWKRWWS